MSEWRKRLTGRGAVAAAIVLAGCGAIFGYTRMGKHATDTPTFQVKREEFLEVLQFRGQVKAMRSVTLTAPSDAGQLQILKIATDGAHVKQGDMIVEFDKSKKEQELAQYRSTLKSAQAEIEQERAQDVLKEEEDLTAVSKAQFDVETAKLEASKQEIVSKIEGGEANLKLADAEQKLNEMQVKLKADRALDRAAVANKTQASKKAAYDTDTAEKALAKMTLNAPADGMVSLVALWHGGGGETPFNPGEQVWPGAPIAELPDSSSLRVTGRVDETERGRLALKQKATVQFDAIPDRQFTGSVEQIGTIASIDFSASWPFPLNFNLLLALDQQDARLKPGLTAQVTVVVDRVPDAIAIPTQAMFQKSGQTVAYVWDGSKFREQTIALGRTSRDRVLVMRGLNAGDRVALKDPTVKQ
ncbi:MAG TPA: HlyD family efflux transporter periplasmic adaptor subunit [Acidobacteriaceae bacterium]|nr:HlyD family efflux transporter periplasmic adaptor subunit [Acidobacteriaceae bacterium]